MLIRVLMPNTVSPSLFIKTQLNNIYICSVLLVYYLITTKQIDQGSFFFGVNYHDMHISSHAKTHINGTFRLALSI